ncbi:MAG TPA: hypothetical protein VEK80_16330 [Kribbellaceae bacterium]|nr:hypothetical protein [Kribbellaceae bacterium]
MGLRKKSNEPVIDPCMGDPGAARLRDALTRQDWPTAREVVIAAGHPDDRAFYLEVGGSVPGVQDWIGNWTGSDPLAQLVRGCHAVAWAWEARGALAAQYTRDEQFTLFFDRLRLAESYLYDVTTRLPEEPVAWSFLIRTARGLQLPVEDEEFRFTEAVRRHPTNLKAHAEFMQSLCAKWGGSDEQMFRFARGAASRSPGGNMLAYLVALCHLEIHLGLRGAERSSYVRRPDVQADLRAAAAHSIWNPAAEFRPGWPLPLNVFAMAFDLSGDRQAAASVFERLGGNVTTFPWGYLGGLRGTEKRFAEARKRALGAR